MTSIKQIEANRRNALRSTGPTSVEGKQRSRVNAYRHGLTAETVIPSAEDAEDYEAFQATVITDYDAQTAIERELVLRLASLLWRLRRASGVETALFEMVTGTGMDGGSMSSVRTEDGERQNQAPVVSAFLRLMELPTAALDRLSRYEYMLWRQARQVICSLEHLRPRQRGSSWRRPEHRSQFDVAGWNRD